MNDTELLERVRVAARKQGLRMTGHVFHENRCVLVLFGKYHWISHCPSTYRSSEEWNAHGYNRNQPDHYIENGAGSLKDALAAIAKDIRNQFNAVTLPQCNLCGGFGVYWPGYPSVTPFMDGTPAAGTCQKCEGTGFLPHPDDDDQNTSSDVAE